jgi:hypothetical protein
MLYPMLSSAPYRFDMRSVVDLSCGGEEEPQIKITIAINYSNFSSLARSLACLRSENEGEWREREHCCCTRRHKSRFFLCFALFFRSLARYSCSCSTLTSNKNNFCIYPCSVHQNNKEIQLCKNEFINYDAISILPLLATLLLLLLLLLREEKN